MLKERKASVYTMNNSQLQAMIDEFGDRIAIIQFDNQCKIYIGYEGSPVRSVEDLQFKTVGGFDMVGVPHKVMNPRDEGKHNLHPLQRSDESDWCNANELH